MASFLLLVGISLVLAERASVPFTAFAKRVAIIAACALAASAASYLVYPSTFITFGILHFIAVASLLARPLATRPALALALGEKLVGIARPLRAPAAATKTSGAVRVHPVTGKLEVLA